MALLEEIDYNPAQDTMEQAFDKINGAIQTINAVLGGGSSGESIKKLSATDFDFGFFDPNNPTNHSDRQVVKPANVSVGSLYTSVGTLTTAPGINRDYIVTASFTILNNNTSSVNGLTVQLVNGASQIAIANKDIISGASNSGTDIITITTLVKNVSQGQTFGLNVKNTTSSGGAGVLLAGCTLYIDGQKA